MRNTTLILGTVASLTFATLTPALATGAFRITPVLLNVQSMGSMTIRRHTDRRIRECTERPIKSPPSALNRLGIATAAIITTAS